MQQNNLGSLAKLHFIIFIWGFTAVLGALIQLDYLVLTWYRMGLASIILLLFILSKSSPRKQLQSIDYKSQLRFIVGGIIIALHWIAFFYAIKLSNVSITLVTLSSGAFFTSLLEPLFFKRKIYLYEIFLGLLILVGFYILLKVEHIDFKGVYYALIAAFLSGLFSVINGIFIEKDDAVQLSFFQLFYGFLFLSLLMLFSGKLTILPMPTQNDWIYLLILASVCTAYAFTVSVDLLRKLSPYTIMLSINLEPVYGIILAVLILGNKEIMTDNFYIGAFFILIIIVLNAVIKHFLKKTS